MAKKITTKVEAFESVLARRQHDLERARQLIVRSQQEYEASMKYYDDMEATALRRIEEAKINIENAKAEEK
jgi:hypothetical protein